MRYSELSQSRRVLSSFQARRGRGTVEIPESLTSQARSVSSAYRFVVSRLTCPSQLRMTLTSTPDSKR